VLDTEPQIVDAYIKPGKLRMVYRHLLQLGERSELLAEASECAAEQGGFWEMRRELYARQDEAYGDTDAVARDVAAQVGLDPEQIGACLDAKTYEQAVRADFAAATAEGIRSRPVFTIGDATLIGAQRFSVFQQRIDAALVGN
jgi:protein-disulfide isomerase